jgi:hypothetical protein
MIGTAAAVLGGISAGTSLLGGLFGSSAASKAAKIQQQNAQHVADMSTQAARDAQSEMRGASAGAIDRVDTSTDRANGVLSDVWAKQEQNLNPYLSLGSTSANYLNAGMMPGGELTKQFSFEGKDLQNDPGYQFALKQGMDALSRSAAAGGTNLSGGMMKGLGQYATDYAGTKFNDAYNRSANTFQLNRSNTLNTLGMGLNAGQNATSNYNQGIENFGNTSAANLNNAGLFGGNTLMNSAQYIGDAGLKGAQIAGDALTGGANAQAAGIVGSANSWSNALGGVGNAAMMTEMLNQGMQPTASAFKGNYNNYFPGYTGPQQLPPSAYSPPVPGPIRTL